METSVVHRTEIINGKEYPLTITRQRGPQEIEVHGVMTQVVSVTITESPMGTSRCFTRAQPELTQGGWESVKQRTREIAAKALIEQGIW